MEDERKKRLDKVKIGDNFKGDIVKQKYFYDNDKNFIIFKNDKDEVIYYGREQITNISSALGKCNYIKELLHSKRMKKWIDAQKAAALNEFFLGNKEKSEEILEVSIETAENTERARKRLIYVGVYLIAVSLLMIILILTKNFYPEWQYMKYLEIVIFGSFGGFVSLNTRLEKIEFSLYETTWSYVLVSVYKIAFACISSIIIYFLIESDIILSVLKNSPGVIYIAATLAGFSESLLPNVFSGLEKDIIEKREHE